MKDALRTVLIPGSGIAIGFMCLLVFFISANSVLAQPESNPAEELPPGSYIEDSADIEEESLLRGKADLNVERAPIAPPIIRAAPPAAPAQLPGQEEPSTSNLKSGILKGIFDLGARKDYGPIVRPDWIPAHAYTNDSMVAPYHNSSLMWWDKSAMPNRPQWVVLSTSVTRFWRGRAANPCWVLVSPNPLAPGNFTFRARNRFGPRGWLQAIPKKSKHGFPLYRYWLDQT